MGKRILIVDDNFDDLNEMSKILEKEGYETSKATNGAQAMDLVDALEFNLVLLDVQMKTLSGYDLMRLLRERLDGKIKIFYVSVVPKKNVDLEGVDGFIQKPFDKNILLKKIKEAL